jgi:hypothetical protein
MATSLLPSVLRASSPVDVDPDLPPSLPLERRVAEVYKLLLF